MKVAPAPIPSVSKNISDHFRQDLLGWENPEDSEELFETIDLNAPEVDDSAAYTKYQCEESGEKWSSESLETGDKADEENDWKQFYNNKIKATIFRTKKSVDPYVCALVFSILAPFIIIMCGAIINAVCPVLNRDHLTKIPAMCLTSNTEEINYNGSCVCGECEGRKTWTCLSTYPCYLVDVTYTSNNTLYRGPARLAGINYSTPCSIDLPKHCYRRAFMNRKLVEEEVTALTNSITGFECVLDLSLEHTVYLKKYYKVTAHGTIVHCYFWPVSILIVVLGWLVYVLYDTITTYRKRVSYARWRKEQPDGYESPPYVDSLLRLNLENFRPSSELTRREKVLRFLRRQIMDKETAITKKKIEFMEAMRNRIPIGVIGTVSRPKLDTYKKSSSHVIRMIERDTKATDEQGTRQKQELTDMIKFLKLEPVPCEDSDMDD